MSPYVAALRESIAEYEATAETDFDDDDDYIFLHYEVTITEDLEIADAIQKVEGIITAVRERADQLVARHRDRLLGIFDRVASTPTWHTLSARKITPSFC